MKRLARRARNAVPYPWSEGVTFGRLHHRFWRSQHWSPERHAAHQLAELQRMVRDAGAHVPYYRELFAKLGFDPEDLRSLDDLKALPITTKAQVQDRPDDFLSDAVPAQARLRRTTSGSTGTPLTLYVTRKTQHAEYAMMARGWRWQGYQPGTRIATAVGELGGPVLGPAHAPHTLHRQHLELSPSHMDARGGRAYLQLLADFRPAHFRTYPSVLLVLGKVMLDEGLEPPPLQSLWTQSEVLYEEDRDFIETQWRAPIADFYGMQEKCVAMSECEAGRMHLHSEFGLIELLPSDHPPLARVIATGFSNEAMPLLRYDTRDLARPSEETCPCGRTLPSVRGIVGRVEDFLVAADGSPVLEVDASIAELTSIRECQIVQESLGLTRVLVVPGPRYDDATGEELVRRLGMQLGAEVEVLVERCDAIPRTTTGKQRFIVSKVTPSWPS